jgi:uncharacterized protein YxeA
MDNLVEKISNSKSSKILFSSGLQAAGGITFTRKVLFAVAIVFIITYGVIILYYYHTAKTSEEEKTLEFTHQVLWGYGGTPGILQVASQSIVTLLTVLIGVFAFKKFMSENETLLNTAKQYITQVEKEDDDEVNINCEEKLAAYKKKLESLSEYLNAGGSVIASNSARRGRNIY